MKPSDVIEKFRQVVIYHGLPQTDMALYGITCPYCGKSDRLRKLDLPGSLTSLSERDVSVYRDLYDRLADGETRLGVCKFCLNIVDIAQNGVATPLQT